MRFARAAGSGASARGGQPCFDLQTMDTFSAGNVSIKIDRASYRGMVLTPESPGFPEGALQLV